MPQVVWIYNQHTSCKDIQIIIVNISLFFKLKHVHDASVISLHFFFICRQLPAQSAHLLLLHFVILVTFMFVIPNVCIYNYLGGSNVNQHINSL
jgi:hypothetical protein